MSVVIVSEQIRLRPVTMDDVEAVVDLLNVYAIAELGVPEHSVDDTRMMWQQPNFNLETSTRIAVTSDNKIIGYAKLDDHTPVMVRINVEVRIHPDYFGQGIDHQLMDWAEERAKQVIDRAPKGARVVLQSESAHTFEPGLNLLKSRGMTYVRSFYHMKIDLDIEPPQPQWPEGITVRLFQRGQDELAMLQVRQDSFQDHWGFIKQPLEETLKLWQHVMDTDPTFDPSLWFLAMNGDQVVGIAICWPRSDDDPDMGWVGTLGVIRPWRRKGLALALLQHSFGEFWQRGKRKVGLGVDAENLTGAMRLYAKAGMSPYRQFDLYEKELRPGKDWMRQSADE